MHQPALRRLLCFWQNGFMFKQGAEVNQAPTSPLPRWVVASQGDSPAVRLWWSEVVRSNRLNQNSHRARVRAIEAEAER